MVCFGVVLHGNLVWYLVWHCMVLHGNLVRFGMVIWCGIAWYVLVWYFVWYCMVCFGMVLYGNLVWYCMVIWYGMEGNNEDVSNQGMGCA